MREVRFNVAGDAHGDQPVVITDNPGPHGREFATRFEGAGRLAVTFDQAHDIDGAASVWYQQRSKTFRIVIPPMGDFQLEASDPLVMPPEYNGDADKVALHYGPVASARPSWDGIYLRKPNGTRYVHRRISGFCDLKIMLDGGANALRPLLQQSQDLGARGRRLFAVMLFITDFNPDAYGQRYWDIIPEYFDLNAQFGQEVDVCVLPDTQARGWSLGKCQDFWARWNQALTPISNKWVNLTNEYDHGGNLVGSPNDYARPADPLVSQGSAVSDAPPPRPGWGRREFHVQKAPPKIYLCEDMYFNRLGVDADGKVWGPVLPTDLSEGPRFSEDSGIYTPWGARCLAHQSIGWGDGMTFHCEGGKNGQLLGPNQAACCQAAMQVLAAAEVEV